jgi:hypothetical protein
LQRVNIGVPLGEASGNLCATDIDNDSGVESFVELNPKLFTGMRPALTFIFWAVLLCSVLSLI